MGRIYLSGRGLNLFCLRKSYKFCSNISKTKHVWFLWVKHSNARTKFHWNDGHKQWSMHVQSASLANIGLAYAPHLHSLGSVDVELRPQSVPVVHTTGDSSGFWWPRSHWYPSSSTWSPDRTFLCPETRAPHSGWSRTGGPHAGRAGSRPRCWRNWSCWWPAPWLQMMWTRRLISSHCCGSDSNRVPLGFDAMKRCGLCFGWRVLSVANYSSYGLHRCSPCKWSHSPSHLIFVWDDSAANYGTNTETISKRPRPQSNTRAHHIFSWPHH